MSTINSAWVLASFTSGKYEEALTKYERLVVEHPEAISQELRNTQGLCYLRLGRCVEAKSVFEQILVEHPQDGEAKANLNAAIFALKRVELDRGDNFFQTGQYEQALQAYATVELSDGEAGDRELKFQLSNNKGACMMQLGRVREALAAFELALSLKPDHVEALHNKGTVLKALDQYDTSLVAYEQCLSLAPEFYPALCGKSEVLSSLGRYQEAIECASRAIAIKDIESRAYSDRGFAYLKSQSYFDAASDFQKAHARGDTSAELQKLLGLSLSLCGDEHSRASNHAEALTCYEHALSFGSADEPNPNLLFNHALALLHADRKQDAIAGFKHVKEINPQHFSACAALGLLCLQDENYEESMVYLQTANELKPEDKDVLYNLGVAALQLQLYERASSKFRELLRMDPHHESAHKALGVVESHLSFVAAQTTGLTAVPQSKPEPPPRVEEEEKVAEVPIPLPPLAKLAPAKAAPVAAASMHHPATTSFPELAPRVETSTAKPPAPAEGVYVQMTFTYEQLIAPGPWPQGVNHLLREQYLHESEFQSVFGMSRDEFNALPKWKQSAKKKELQLF